MDESERKGPWLMMHYAGVCNPCEGGGGGYQKKPWKDISKTPASPTFSDVQLILINTRATCNDAGNFSCNLMPEWKQPIITASQILRRKTSCDTPPSTTTSTTSTLPTETTSSSDNGTDATSYTEPTTQRSGFGVSGPEKGFILTEMLLSIVIKVL
ncbi:unnamed protein product [Lymnaea stagnalis]|uniref:Uncharacterized protein n=1 Tax=Lymnaea stagnalis TaxID=6523 RepID=A0AAV2II27_LYMST